MQEGLWDIFFLKKPAGSRCDLFSRTSTTSLWVIFRLLCPGSKKKKKKKRDRNEVQPLH